MRTLRTRSDINLARIAVTLCCSGFPDSDFDRYRAYSSGYHPGPSTSPSTLTWDTYHHDVHEPHSVPNMATSTPPYLLTASQATARASVCGYHRRDFDLAVTWFAPDEHASIAGSIATTVREPATSLAVLDSLPLELIHAIILQMDVRTAFHFRQINLRARQVVNQLHEYKIVAAHALNGFCALLRTGTAERITLAELYRCICTNVCSICKGRYGNLVQLLT